MNLYRLLTIAFFISTTFSTYSSVEGTNLCEDRHYFCPSFSNHCRMSLVQMGCRLTCGICQPDRCAYNNGGCKQLCEWTGIETSCSCFPGYRLADDNHTCEDINECIEGPNPCSAGTLSHCVNTVGSYSCQASTCPNSAGQMNYYRSGECCTVTNGSCGMTSAIDEVVASAETNPIIRVFGGRAAAHAAWPWQAQIVYRGHHRCGASLIANQWLIGAAHCFENYSYQNMLVYLGQIRGAHMGFDEVTRRTIRSISNVIVPPTASAHLDDIALIELSTPVTFSNTIRPICLPCGEEPKVGTKCWATGFGRTEPGTERFSDILREVDLPVVSHDTCARAFRTLFDIDERQMTCAGYSEGRKDTCVGDSGGPLACQRSDSCQWYLSGVTSFGKGCAIPGYYGIYTKVTNYESWLRENLRGRNVTGLCERFLNPCRNLRNLVNDCYDQIDRCTTYPHYMQFNCALACCQLRHNEIPNCYDDLDAVEMCERLKNQCNAPRIGVTLRAKCRKTCKVC